MAGVAKLFNGNILNKSNEIVDLTDEKYKGKIIGLYFSAHWCIPCRSFTPILKQFYENYAKEKNLEIIYISSDKDEKSFHEYYEEMPWLTLDFNAIDKNEDLSDKYFVRAIPTLILLDGDSGRVLSVDAREQIQSKDVLGKKFPWRLIPEKGAIDCVLL